jgi:hypothetical protein
LSLLWNREKLADGTTPPLSISLTLQQEGPQKVHISAAIHECLRRHECTNGQTRAASIRAFVGPHSWMAVPLLQVPNRLRQLQRSLHGGASRYLAKSPTRTVTTQTNPFFAAFCAHIKLERRRCGTKLNR